MSTTASAERPTVLLTFDVEDWFQVENFKSSIPRSAWNRCELRVWKNTIAILDILDKAPGAPRATFFILGWVAERLPALVRRILAGGHEIASHGFGHGLCQGLSPEMMATDLEASKTLLEKIAGVPVTGYRAPSFSITTDALGAVKAAGYRYDASFNNFGSNSRYGAPDLSCARFRNGVYRLDTDFFEVPVSNLNWHGTILPLGGGGYFRLFPFPLFRRGMDRVLSRERAFVFYAHPWEFDPGQPRVHRAPAGFKFRHYINLAKTRAKLEALIHSFSHCRFATISGYLDALEIRLVPSEN